MVQEYTMRVMEIMRCSDAHWVGTDDNGSSPSDVLELDGYFFLSWSDVQMLVDHYAEWKARYTADGVREEVEAWQEWALGDYHEDPLMELFGSRRDLRLRTYPRINLEHWLMGCPREPRKKSDYEILLEMKLKLKLLEELSETYRSSRSIGNIISNIEAEIKTLEEKIKHGEATDA